MNTVFADTLYWIAISRASDPWHEPAATSRLALGNVLIVTTTEVLTEYLNAMSGAGADLRARAARAVHAICTNPRIHVVSPSQQSFDAGVDLYQRRPDKSYSLTDCISMNVMRTEGITDALTNDRHFAQEGFKVLIQR